MEMNSMVFNTFVWLQFFNIFVNRRLDNRQNIFEGFWRNKFFLIIVALILGIQILIMFVGGAAFSIVRQTGAEWATAIICGLVSIPCGAVLRTVPDAWVAKLYPPWLDKIVMTVTFQHKKTKVDDSEMSLGYEYRWNPAIEHVRNELRFLKKVRGGRLSALKFRPREIYQSMRIAVSPSPSPLQSPSLSEDSNSPTSTMSPGSPYFWDHTSPGGNGPFLTVPGTPSRGHMMRRRSSDTSGSSITALTMVPVIVSGAIGGWSPEQVDRAHERSHSDHR
jgi:Ca2+-transporting ATPase